MTGALDTSEVTGWRAPSGPAGVRPAGPAGTRPLQREEAPVPSLRQRVAAMAAGFTTLYLEVEAGRRPRGQLAPLLTPMLYARLSQVWVRGGSPGCVLSVRVVALADDACDVVAVVRRRSRCGAVALRLVRTRRGWLVDDVALPELGPLPLPAYPVVMDEPDDSEDLTLIPRPERVGAATTESADWYACNGPGYHVRPHA